jgi:hypothetical protein
MWAGLTVMLLTVAVQADWYVYDGHKMHYPQMPDENGWGVDVTRGILADDFMCSQTGFIEDIHFWIAWKGGYVGEVQEVCAWLYADVPAGADPDPSIKYSHPGELVWSRIFSPNMFSVIDYGQGEQGWYSPFTDPVQHIGNDHFSYQQVNIEAIIDPFYQRKGTIYWLALQVIPASTNGYVGWKTTLSPYNDTAVYFDDAALKYIPLIYDDVAWDLAFVITPEPTTFLMCAMGGFAIARRRC